MHPATSEIDLFGDDTLSDTPTWYGMLCNTGPVVYLPRNDLYAISIVQRKVSLNVLCDSNAK